MIKRLLLSLAAMIAVMTAGAQDRQLILSHEGSPSFFALTEMDKALEAAQPNDTIFVPECKIAPFKITKPVTILGTGRNSVINGDVDIEIKDQKYEVENALLDGLQISGYVRFMNNTTLGTYHIRFCYMSYLQAGYDYSTFNYNMPSLLIESCFICETLMLGPCVQTASIYNSKIHNIMGSAKIANYAYCNIYFCGSGYQPYFGKTNGNFHKCIISRIEPNINPSNIFLDNSLISYTAVSKTDLQWNNTYITEDQDPINPQTLDSKAAYTIDGNEIIGAEGGTSPYSEYPSLPTITQSSVEMDAENRLIKISLKIGGKTASVPESQQIP